MEKINLDQLAIKYGNDKSSLKHDYMRIYEKHFKSLQGSAKVILELGVWKGTSLQIWEEYFPAATIYGIDSEPACKNFESGRRYIAIGKQEDVNFLLYICGKIEAPDIIIDDCGHILNHQITSFRFLYPILKRGGFYCIEDLSSKALDEFLRVAKELRVPVKMVYKGKLRNEMLLILSKPADLQGTKNKRG